MTRRSAEWWTRPLPPPPIGTDQINPGVGSHPHRRTEVSRMGNPGLPRLTAAIALAWRDVERTPCRICGGTSAGAVETIAGPLPACAEHLAGAEARGYTVRRLGGEQEAKPNVNP